MPDSGHRFYEEEEAEQILRLAATFVPISGAISRNRLLQTAAELGITPEAVELAESKFAEQKLRRAESAEFDTEKKREFFSYLMTFIVINGSIVALNLFAGARYMWAFWLTGPTLIGLAFNAVETFSKNSKIYQDSFDKWKSKKVRKLAAEELAPSAEPDPSIIIDAYIHRRLDRGKEVSKLDAVRHLLEKTCLDSVDAKEFVEQYSVQNPGILD